MGDSEKEMEALAAWPRCRPGARLETAGVPVLESLTQVPAFLRDLQA